MDDLTAKTHEIRRLHAVCRAKNDAVRQTYREQVRLALSLTRNMVAANRARGSQVPDHKKWLLREQRDACLYAARVLKAVLKELE